MKCYTNIGNYFILSILLRSIIDSTKAFISILSKYYLYTKNAIFV